MSGIALGGAFTPGTGTNAVKGLGATSPLAGGINSLAQGSGCSAPGPNGFAQGLTCTASGIYVSFAQGFQCTASASYAFAQGYTCVASGSPYGAAFAQGYNATASHRNTFAQGSSATANKEESFAQGAAALASGNYSFAQGLLVTASGTSSFARGFSTTASGEQGFASGRSCTAAGDRSVAIGRACAGNDSNSWASGYNCGADKNAFVHGSLCYAATRAAFAQGVNVDLRAPSALAANYGVLAQGVNIYLAPGHFASSILQGRTITGGATTWATLAQGESISTNGYNVLAQGYAITAFGALAGPTYGGVLAQGTHLSVSGGRLLAQGSYLSLAASSDDCLVQGSYIQPAAAQHTSLFQGATFTFNATAAALRCLVQGSGHTLGAGALYNAFAQGESINLSGAQGNVFLQGDTLAAGSLANSVFVQGSSIQVPSTAPTRACAFQGDSFTFANATASFSYCAVLGSSHDFGALANTFLSTFIQGRNHQLTNDCRRSFIAGSDHSVGADTVFALGYAHSVTGNSGCAIGQYNTVVGNEGFAFGRRARAPRNQQRTFAADSDVANFAQFSFIDRYLSTANATQTTLMSLTLDEDKAYSIQINLVVRNTTTNTENASFVLLQAIAYRDTAGAAVLQGSPVALTRQDTGGGSVNLLAELDTSGNDVRLRVTGEAGETYHWCAHFEFVEVSG